MKIAEFLVERIQTDWIGPWVERTVLSLGPYKNDQWYSTLLSKLNSSKELKTWAKSTLGAPLVIGFRLGFNDKNKIIIDADHIVKHKPLKHHVSVQFNSENKPETPEKIKQLIFTLSSHLAHEFAHANQRARQNYEFVDTSVWKFEPPAPRNDVEKHYIYILHNAERDAWVSHVANDIYSRLGKDSIKYLNKILQQSKKDDQAMVGSRIIPISGLYSLNRALQYYRQFLKTPPEQAWDKIKKELYGYLSRYDRTK